MSVLRTFRSLLRRGGLLRSRAGDTLVQFQSGPDGVTIRSASADVAIEYRQSGEHPAKAYCLPVSSLADVEGGSSDGFTIEVDPSNRITMNWTNRGVPRQSVVDPAKKELTFPKVPTAFVSNDPRLWQALQDAAASTDKNSSRYALNCLLFRGATGRIDATDGHHVFTQAGYRFDWDDDVLIPATPLLGCKELDQKEPIAVGRTDDWVAFGTAGFLVMHRIYKDGRFPKIDQILPNAEAAKSRLTLSDGDARFLADKLPRLPCDDQLHDPVTLDLNGRVLVRARESKEARPTEVELPSSSLAGEPVIFNSNRRFVERALKLGFRDVRVYGSNSPVLCRDELRQYLWALLDKEGVVPRCDDPVRIIPSGEASQPRSSSIKPVEVPVTVAIKNQVTASATGKSNDDQPTRRDRMRSAATAIEQATALRDALRGVAQQAGELARSLKQQRRQAKIVATTLASLKELQKVAG